MTEGEADKPFLTAFEEIIEESHDQKNGGDGRQGVGNTNDFILQKKEMVVAEEGCLKEQKAAQTTGQRAAEGKESS